MMVKTNISRSYVESWGITEALREVIQENLDVRKKYGCTGKIAYSKKGYLVSEDDGPGLQRQDLALGVSGKRNGGTLIGQFGEGLKLAALIAARENREMRIETVGFTVFPRLEYEPALECDVLAFHLFENDRSAGTKIVFQASEDEYRTAVGLFLELGGCKAHKKLSPKILFPGGRVYINGALAAERKDLLFSYDLAGESAKLAQNRDRTVVDEEALLKEITGALNACKRQEVVETLFRDMAASYASLEGKAYLDPPDKSLPLWRRALKKVYGPRVCLSSDAASDLEAEEEMGFVVLKRVPWRWEACLRRLGVKSSMEVTVRSRPRSGRVALKDLYPEEKENLRWAKRVAKRAFSVKELPKIRVVSEIPSNGSEEVTGLHDKGVIYLLRDVLFRPEEVLGALLHEMMHHVTGAPDCSREFERGWQRLAVRMLLKRYRLPEAKKGKVPR